MVSHTETFAVSSTRSMGDSQDTLKVTLLPVCPFGDRISQCRHPDAVALTAAISLGHHGLGGRRAGGHVGVDDECIVACADNCVAHGNGGRVVDVAAIGLCLCAALGDPNPTRSNLPWT